jgi:hypothetical protein
MWYMEKLITRTTWEQNYVNTDRICVNLDTLVQALQLLQTSPCTRTFHHLIQCLQLQISRKFLPYIVSKILTPLKGNFTILLSNTFHKENHNSFGM